MPWSPKGAVGRQSHEEPSSCEVYLCPSILFSTNPGGWGVQTY